MGFTKRFAANANYAPATGPVAEPQLDLSDDTKGVGKASGNGVQDDSSSGDSNVNRSRETWAQVDDPRFYKPIDSYEGLHRWDPEFEWEPKEEKRLVRKVRCSDLHSWNFAGLEDCEVYCDTTLKISAYAYVLLYLNAEQTASSSTGLIVWLR